MTTAIYILLAQGALGAFDTFYYHEYRARLPSTPKHWRELILHGLRNVAYGVIFLCLAWTELFGAWAAAFGALLLFEIVVTLLDFLEEDRRRPLFAGERITHTLMAILYGAFLAHLLPILFTRLLAPTRVRAAHNETWLAYLLTALALGVLCFAVRDLTKASEMQRRDDAALRVR